MSEVADVTLNRDPLRVARVLYALHRNQMRVTTMRRRLLRSLASSVCGLPVWLAVTLAAACTGPGLEPPDRQGQSAGGVGGSGGSGGFGGMNASAGGGGAGHGAPSVETPLDGGDGVPDDDGADAATDADVDAGTSGETRELIGPRYMGSVNNSAECSMSYPTRGHEPAASDDARHPLFLYFVGTAFVATDASAQYDSPAPLAVTEAMARRGFVALSVQYDNGALAWLSDHANQLACLFESDAPSSLIARACALPNVDCDLGIATWGHSQGGYVAAMAYNREPRVRAVWATGYGGDAATQLPFDRLRVVNGEHDASDNGTAAKLSMITGFAAGECTQPDQCLREDGSGWIIVRQSELAMPQTSSADHCWFDRTSCNASAITLEPSWVDPMSDKPFALERNADWVALATRR